MVFDQNNGWLKYLPTEAEYEKRFSKEQWYNKCTKTHSEKW